MLDVDIEVDRRDFTVAVRLSVAPGERLALFGPSGAGKTTVLETIAGLVSPRRGHVAVAGRTLTRTTRPRRSVPPWRRRVGLLRQNPALFPHLSVERNICYAPGAAARSTELAEVTRRLGIAHLLDARPAALSGGQAHRVALARLVLAPCDVLLLDEPYTGLDVATRRELTDMLRDVVERRGVPAVLVAHELTEAQAFADRIAVLDRGVIHQVASPHEVVARPADRRVAALVGYSGFVPLAADGHRADGLPGTTGVVGVHPDRVIPGEHPDRGVVLTGVVTAVRPAAARWETDVDVVGRPVRCILDKPPTVGGRLVVTAVDAPVFATDGTLLPSGRTRSVEPGGGARR